MSIVSLDTPGAQFRQRRWEMLGRPDADPTAIEFHGTDAQRDVVVDVLSRLPPAVRHFAVEGITWIGIGPTTKAWTSPAPKLRTLPDDPPTWIVLSRIDAGTVAHELGHAWHRVPLAKLRESSGKSILEARGLDMPEEMDEEHRIRWVSIRVENELIADEQAKAWGIPHDGLSAREIVDMFLDQYDAAFAAARTARGDR